MPASQHDLNKLPASFLYETRKDPAEGLQSSPPNFGQPFLEHIHTVNGRYGLVSHSYLNIDEALLDSRRNAYRMRNDCGIMESLHARQRATALLNWHIEPEDSRSQEQKQLALEMTDILAATPRFTEMRRALLEALWYGRYLTTSVFKKDRIQGKWRTVVRRWEPRNGDKLKFRYDDGSKKYVEGQIGIRVGTAYASPRHFRDPRTGDVIHKIQASEDGLIYWLDRWERDTCVLHKHMIEDGPYWEPKMAGKINGVGIRDFIYWDWYAMVECLQRVVEYLDRAAFGVEVWPYPAGSDTAKQKTEAAASEAMGGGRTIILAPISPGEDQELYLPRLIEPGLGGIETTINMIRTYWGHKIKRFILGQVLSSEAEATGLGSGVADAHLATLADIVKYDATNLEESITDDYLPKLQNWNFPASNHIKLKFRIDTEDPDAQSKMAGFKSAWDMGLGIKASEVADVIGAAMPDPDDEILKNPSMSQAPMSPMDAIGNVAAQIGQPGQLPSPGVPASAPVNLGQMMDQAAAGGAAMQRNGNGSFANRLKDYLAKA